MFCTIAIYVLIIIFSRKHKSESDVWRDSNVSSINKNNDDDNVEDNDDDDDDDDYDDDDDDDDCGSGYPPSV